MWHHLPIFMLLISQKVISSSNTLLSSELLISHLPSQVHQDKEAQHFLSFMLLEVFALCLNATAPYY